MKKLLSILAMLIGLQGTVMAVNDPWTVVTGNGQDRTVVIANLQLTIGGQTVSAYSGDRFVIGAFIGDECRWKGSYTQDPAAHYEISVWGNFDNSGSDSNKPITFRVFDKDTGLEFPLTCDRTINWAIDQTVGSSSDMVQLSLIAPSVNNIGFGQFEVGTGESVDLRNYVTGIQTGEELPLNLTWDLGNSSSFATINGYTLTAGNTPHLDNPITMRVGRSNYNVNTYFDIVKHATAINIVTSTIEVEKDDANLLSSYMHNWQNYESYQLSPTDATDPVRWEVDPDYIETVIDPNNGPTMYKPIKAGTTTIRPYFVNTNGQNVYPQNPGNITVNIVVKATGISLNWPNGVTFKCNVDDDIYQRIKNIVEISPDAATDKNFIIDTQDQGYLTIVNSSKSVVALKEGTTSVIITHAEAGEVELSIQIFNPAKTIAATQDNISLSESTTKNTAVQIIADNITWGPDGSTPNGTITTTDQWGSGSITPNGKTFMIGDDKELTGDHEITATLSWNDYSNYDGTDATVSTQTASCSFIVSFFKQLSGFTITISPNASNPTQGTITLTPIPTNASEFNMANFRLMASNPYGDFGPTDENWTNPLTIEATADDKVFNYSSSLPGTYTVTVLKKIIVQGNMEMWQTFGNGESFEVPAQVDLANGWQWKSNPYGDVGNTIEAKSSFFGKGFNEARTYDDLLYNDINWGLYGSMITKSISQSQMYKVKMQGPQTSYITGGTLSADDITVGLVPGWNWVGSPYLFSRTLSVLGGGTNGMVIVSKTASAEHNGTKWSGGLTVIEKGQGYLIYNPGTTNVNVVFANEKEMGQSDEHPAGARNRASITSVWEYDHTQFASNMTMVVEMPDLQDVENYTIGAFVDGECRGEGIFEDGFGFVTVHCNSGELVNFQLHNELTGEYYDIDQTVMSQMRVGSLKSPYLMTSKQIVTGIGSINSNDVSSQLFDLNGRQLNSQRKGVSIQRKADCTVRKVVVR